MLLAASDQYGSNIDVKTKFREDSYEERGSDSIAAVFGKSVSYNGGTLRNEVFEEEDIYINFGSDTIK